MVAQLNLVTEAHAEYRYWD